METDIAMAYCEGDQDEFGLIALETPWPFAMCNITAPSTFVPGDNIWDGSSGFIQPSPFSSTADSSYESSANAITPGSDNSSYSVPAPQDPQDTLCDMADTSATFSFDSSNMQWSQSVCLGDPMYPEGSAASSFAEFDFNTHVETDDDFVLRAFPPLDDLDFAMNAAFYASEASEATVTTTTTTTTATGTGTPITPNPAMDLYSLGSSSQQSSSSSTSTMHVCATCSRGFKSRGGLHKHEKTHTRPHICPVCGEGQGAKRDTLRHMWAQHPQEAVEMGLPSVQSQCPHCHKVQRDDNMKRHIRTQHQDVVA